MNSLKSSALVDNAVVRTLAGVAGLVRGLAQFAFGRTFAGAESLSWVYRVSGRRFLRQIALGTLSRYVRRALTGPRNELLSAFLDGPAHRAIDRYSLGGTGELDLFRDVIVLKSPAGREKGVVLLKYTETFEAFMAYFDVDRVTDYYRLVLEPSWAGYCDPSILMYVMGGEPVLVQCFTEDDHEFIRALDSNLHAVRLGPADWTPVDDFATVQANDRVYDLVMVANWGRHKQHIRLFRALRDVARPIRLLLVGYPWGGRTTDDIRREARILPPHVSLEVAEQVTHEQVASYLWQSKVLVFLSKKEGDNKAIVEGFFADVPAIVYRDSIGGAKSRINERTGILASYEDLGDNIGRILETLEDFSPREWALENSGSARATQTLENALRQVATARGEPFEARIAQKANAPNLDYRGGARAEDFSADYRRLLSLRRPRRNR